MLAFWAESLPESYKETASEIFWLPEASQLPGRPWCSLPSCSSGCKKIIAIEMRGPKIPGSSEEGSSGKLRPRRSHPSSPEDGKPMSQHRRAVAKIVGQPHRPKSAPMILSLAPALQRNRDGRVILASELTTAKVSSASCDIR